ncbi:MAG: hypothetical protein P4M11_08890 [Candidatus Pacebacteria bacterium]|nr:hypothetical protein [Candidatus Paceibacterota bacterium]
MLELCDYIDRTYPELFYFVPEYYITAVSAIVKAFLRMDPQGLDFLWTKCSPAMVPREALLDRFITFVTNHISDKRIPNPDQQESFLIKLGILLQYRDVVSRLETHPVAKTKLVPAFLRDFGKSNVNALAKNFLRLFKKNLYNDLAYTVLPDYGSEYFRKQFVELCTADIKLREAFLNTFLDHLNNTLTELKLHYSECSNISLTTRERDQHKRDSRVSYSILYDMLRVLETTVSLIPFVFLEADGLFRQRAADLCMLVIREGIQGQLGRFLSDLASEDCILNRRNFGRQKVRDAVHAAESYCGGVPGATQLV